MSSQRWPSRTAATRISASFIVGTRESPFL